MAVVKIVETGSKYASLEKAAAAAVAGQTIALTDDIDLSGYARSAGHEIAFADNVTFDLAGFTVSMKNFGVEFLGNGLTVSNGTFKSVGERPNYSVYFGDWNNEQAEYTGLTLVDLTCEGGVGVYKTKGALFRDLQVTEAAAKNMYYAVNASGGSEVTIEGGSYESSVTDNSILLRAGTDADAYTIKSGSFRAVDRTDVALCMAGKATVYGGTFGMDPTAFLAEGYAAKPGTEPQTWTVVEKQSEVVVDDVKVLDADGNVIENEAAAAQAAAIRGSVVAMATSAAVAGFEGTDIKAITTTEDGRMVDALVEAFGKTDEEKAALAASTWNHEWLSNSLNRVLCDVSGDAASLKRLVYTVKPYATVNYTMGQLVKKLTVQIPNSVLVGKPITFRLGVIWDVDDQVKVWRDDEYFGITTVKNDGNVKFVEIKSDNFSEFALEKVTDPTPTVCEVNGQAYESVAAAIAANTESPTAVIKLTAACGEQELPLLWGQEIDVNGQTFTGSIVPTEEPESGFAADQYEQVQTPAGRVFSAPKQVSVTTAGGTIKVRIPGKTAGDLEVVQTSGRPLWQDLVMGSDVKLIPQVPRSAIGTNTVTIRSNLDDAAVAAAAKVRDGVRVKYQLMKKVGGSGTYAQFGAAQDTPVFTVEADKLEVQTFWKILTIFDEEY